MLVILNAGLFAKQLLPELVLVYRGREWANTLRRNPITRLTDNTSSIAAICIFCNAKRWIGAADVFLEIVMQPFLGFDDIVPDSSSPATV